MNRSISVGVSLFIVLAAAFVAGIAVQGQPVAPVPAGPNTADNPYNIVLLSSEPEYSVDWASPDAIAAQFGTLTFSSWEDFTSAEIHPLDAVIIHSTAKDFVDREWLADAFFNRGVVVAAVNLDWPEFYPLLGLDHCEFEPMDTRISAYDHVMIRSYYALGDIPAEADAQIAHQRETCFGHARLKSKSPVATAYILQSESTYKGRLDADYEMINFSRALMSKLRSIDRSVEAFILREHHDTLTPELFRERMLRIGMSLESIEPAIQAIWGGGS